MVDALILRKFSLLESNKISDFTKIFILCNYKVDKIKQQLCYRRPPTLSRRLQTKISYTLFAIMYIPSIVCTVYNLLKPVLVLHALHCKHTQPTLKIRHIVTSLLVQIGIRNSIEGVKLAFGGVGGQQRVNFLGFGKVIQRFC